MKLVKLIAILALSTVSLISNAETNTTQVNNAAITYSGVNRVEFNDAKNNKEFVGNGFLIEYQNKTYAVTVKHALFEIKTAALTHVDIAEQVAAWYIHPLKNKQEYVKLGRLINTDPNELIDIKILQKDWLLFEVADNQSNLQVLKLRDGDLIEGELVSAFGCTYATKANCRQDQYQFRFVENDTHNLRLTMGEIKLDQLRGLSGSPVVDKNNQVVGIVSNVLKKKSGDGFDFAPANLSYLRSILQSQSR